MLYDWAGELRLTTGRGLISIKGKGHPDQTCHYRKCHLCCEHFQTFSQPFKLSLYNHFVHFLNEKLFHKRRLNRQSHIQLPPKYHSKKMRKSIHLKNLMGALVKYVDRKNPQFIIFEARMRWWITPGEFLIPIPPIKTTACLPKSPNKLATADNFHFDQILWGQKNAKHIDSLLSQVAGQ